MLYLVHVPTIIYQLKEKIVNSYTQLDPNYLTFMHWKVVTGIEIVLSVLSGYYCMVMFEYLILMIVKIYCRYGLIIESGYYKINL